LLIGGLFQVPFIGYRLPWFAMVCLKFDKLALKMTGSCRYSSCQQLPSEFGIIKQPDFLSCDSHDTLDSWNHACIMVVSWLYHVGHGTSCNCSVGCLVRRVYCTSTLPAPPLEGLSRDGEFRSCSRCRAAHIVTILSSGQPEVSPLSSNICQQD
jgi:hypothetical protein